MPVDLRIVKLYEFTRSFSRLAICGRASASVFVARAILCGRLRRMGTMIVGTIVSARETDRAQQSSPDENFLEGGSSVRKFEAEAFQD